MSVLMPCYNAAETLPEALEDLACQTLADYEIIAVEDGSQDETAEILHSWAAREPRLRVIRTSHQGIVAALQAGLDECQAPLVARMDADDRCHPARLERQLAFMDSHPEVDLAGCLVRAIPPEQVRQGFAVYLEWQNSLLSDQDIRREIFVESPFAHPSVIFRRQAVQQAGGYQDNGWPEDYDLWLRLYLAGARFGKVPEVLLDWRESPQRLTRSDARYSLENFLRAKACYLARGPLSGRAAVIVWGAGMMGRRLSKHLVRNGLPLVAYVDIDPRKVGSTRRGLPVLAPEELPNYWQSCDHPALIAAVGARGARGLIRAQLERIGLQEGEDWWSAA